ncbi:hypothetical protein SAMN04489806_0981 [Paramicrobacterium humi]|uniref:Uncharacterized protein n=1 Tax=Paramicrobacterium humi TaxID=640635 RepID=A0A1H4K287_9MICO|nr:hypothetical protein SAMN04489806_0981 [Microbacterium humi]
MSLLLAWNGQFPVRYVSSNQAASGIYGITHANEAAPDQEI